MKLAYSILLSLFIWNSLNGQSCLQDGINIFTQEAIDSFKINYPDCSVIEGHLIILGSEINNLDSLNNLEKIIGNFKIISTSIEDFEGISNLDSIFGGFEISLSHQISSLSGLENLVYANMLNIESNNALTTLNGLNTDIHIDNRLNIGGNQNLENIDALNNISHFDGGIYITGNESLLKLNGLSNLESVSGRLRISANSITNLEGLEKLNSIGGSFEIYGNNTLNNLQGLNVLEYIGWNFDIWGNQSFQSFDGLNNLDTIKNMFRINENESLLNFSSLSDMNFHIGQGMEINSNENLTNLNGLNEIEIRDSFSFIKIDYNPSLSNCNAKTVCDHLENNGGSIVSNNLDGCNSEFEIINSCLVNALDILNDNPKEIYIYPNPSQGNAELYVSNNIIVSVIKIYNSQGILVLKSQNSNSLNLNNLEQGLYLVEINSNNNRYYTKLIIN